MGWGIVDVERAGHAQVHDELAVGVHLSRVRARVGLFGCGVGQPEQEVLAATVDPGDDRADGLGGRGELGGAVGSGIGHHGAPDQRFELGSNRLDLRELGHDPKVSPTAASVGGQRAGRRSLRHPGPESRVD